MSSPKISIALATHNGEAHLPAQLQSFSDQSQLPDELVVCDDDSRDSSVSLLETFAQRAPFAVRIERNPQRLGTSANFERAIGLCRGELIFLADQDDVWLRDKIRVQAGYLETHPAVGACFSNGRNVDAEGRPLGHSLWEALWFSGAERERVRSGRAVEVFLKHVVAAGTTLAFRASYRELLLPFPALRSCHDAWIAFLIAAAGQIMPIDEELILYRLHGANQIGLSKAGLLEQIQRAKGQLASDPDSGVGNAFEYAERFFSAALERLEAPGEAIEGRLSDKTRAQIHAKVSHSKIRAQLPKPLWKRLPQVLGEAMRGNYGRYSYGLKSVAQDLWLR